MRRKKQLNHDTVRIFGIMLIVVISVLWAGMALHMLLTTSPLFMIKNVEVVEGISPMDIPEFVKIRGINLFAVDLLRSVK